MSGGVSHAISDLLPHGPEMTLLDAMTDCRGDSATCVVTIRADSRFCERGAGVPGWVGIEYMAQALAAYEGLVRLQAGKSVQIGLLLGTRRYDCAAEHFAVGTQLTVRVTQLVRGADGVTAFDCSLADGERILATAQIKAYQPDDIAAYLRELGPA